MAEKHKCICNNNKL